jgi:hypothetical protein
MTRQSYWRCACSRDKVWTAGCCRNLHMQDLELQVHRMCCGRSHN